jgi:murein DD-endopeptidase MepM/ murein hydrolase activator NlpD
MKQLPIAALLGILLVLTTGCTLQTMPFLQEQVQAKAPIRIVKGLRTVVVKPGQDLYKIAHAYSVPMRDLIQTNHLQAPFFIQANDRLVLPNTREHIVRSSETLAEIARRYGTNIKQVVTMNHLSPPYTLQYGQRLRLPAGSAIPLSCSPQRPPYSPKTKNIPNPNRGGGRQVTIIQNNNTFDSSKTQQLLKTQPGLTSNNNSDRPTTGKQEIQSQRRLASTTSPLRKIESESPKKTTPLLPPPSKSSSLQQETSKPKTFSSRSKEQAIAEKPVRDTEAAPPTGDLEKPTALRPTTSIGSLSNHVFQWPVTGGIIIGRYGYATDGSRNDGINIRADRGAPIAAANAGIVSYVGSEVRGYGNLVLVRHAGNWVTAYAHADQVLVNSGDQVSAGQTIATVGTTGSVSEPQLHFELRRGAEAVDPVRYLPKG